MLGVVTNPTMTAADVAIKARRRRDGRRGTPSSRTPVGVLLRRGAGRSRRRPVLRRRGPGAHGLHRVRRVHDRLPAQRQEHAGQELPRPRRGRRRGRASPDHGDRRPAARGGRWAVDTRATESLAARATSSARRRWARAGRVRRRLRARADAASDLHGRPRGLLRRHLGHPAACCTAAARRRAARALAPTRRTSPGPTPSRCSASASGRRRPAGGTSPTGSPSRRRSTPTRTRTSSRSATARAPT